MTAVLWAAAATVGFVTYLINAFDATVDIRVLDVRDDTDGRWLIARSNLRRQLVSAAAYLAYAAVGTIVAFEFMPPSDRRGQVIVWGVLVGVVLGAVNSMLDRTAKHRLLRLYSSEMLPPASPPV